MDVKGEVKKRKVENDGGSEEIRSEDKIGALLESAIEKEGVRDEKWCSDD